MTNLSKELCEVCGIKPRYGVYQNFGDLDNDYRLVTNVRKCRLIADTRYDVDDEVLRNLKPIYYPDFEQAENFVKLGELKLNYENYTTIFYLVNYLSDNSWCTKKEFLKYLLSILSNTNTYEFYIQLQEKTKQAIREEEWIYD